MNRLGHELSEYMHGARDVKGAIVGDELSRGQLSGDELT